MLLKMTKLSLFFCMIFFVVLLIWSPVQKLDETRQHPIKTSGAYKALNNWAAARAYPENDIPAAAYYQAFAAEQSRRLAEKKERDYPDPWEAIGPHNIGGRTVALEFNPQNPNTIYAGSASGGLWRSYTGGVGVQAWEYVPTGFPVLGVSGIAIAEDDSNTIYIGSGEVYNYQNALGGTSVRITRGSYGIGILKTTDGGDTWTKSLDWSYNQQRGVQDMVVDPQNSNNVWAATTEGVFKSTDAGETWQNVHPVVMAMNLEINPNNPDIVFVGCGNLYSGGHGLYRTADGGENWTKLTNGLPNYFGGKVWLSIYEANPHIIYASIGNGYTSNAGTWLCRSTNNGDSWTTVNTTDYATYQGWFAHVVGVHPADSSIVICAGVDVFKSNDSGTTLQQKGYWNHWYFGVVPPGGPEGPPDYSHADHHTIAFHPQNPDVVYFGNDGGVFRSLDAGETFEGCNGGYQSTQFYNGFATSQLNPNRSIGGFQDNASAIYQGETAWRRVLGGDGCWTAIDANNDDIMYGSSQGLYVSKSTNGGDSWFSLDIPTNGSVNFVAPFVVAMDNPQLIYAGRSYVFKSINGGASWTTTNNSQSLNGNPVLSMAVAPTVGNICYAATVPASSRMEVFRTVNGGSSWASVTGELPDRYPMDIAIDPLDPFTVYIVLGGFGTPHVFRSENGGVAWSDVSGNLPDLPTLSVTVDPDYPEFIYVGNDLGVYFSPDNGQTWHMFSHGLPDAVMAMDLSISPTNRVLRVATHGNGAYERALMNPENLGILDNPAAIANIRVRPNYPNPFNPSTTISYELPRNALVSIAIYNSAGQLVRTLLKPNYQSAGLHEIHWDGQNEKQEETASGTYLCEFNADDEVIIQRLTLIK